MTQPASVLLDRLLMLIPDLKGIAMGDSMLLYRATDPDCGPPLSVDCLITGKGMTRLAISHYHVIGGDAVADPDLVIEIDWAKGEAKPLAYQDPWGDYAAVQGRYVALDSERFDADLTRSGLATSRQQLTEFMGGWLDGLVREGYARGAHHECTRYARVAPLPIGVSAEQLMEVMVTSIRQERWVGCTLALRAGCDPQLPLTIAVDQNLPRLVDKLLREGGGRCNPDGIDGSLLCTAARRGYVEVADRLIAHGADVNAGDTLALGFAVANGWPAIVSRLLEAGANPNAQGAQFDPDDAHAFPECMELLRAARDQANSMSPGMG
jgi:hypothetical protein